MSIYVCVYMSVYRYTQHIYIKEKRVPRLWDLPTCRDSVATPYEAVTMHKVV
jgi:hypothetical protein